MKKILFAILAMAIQSATAQQRISVTLAPDLKGPYSGRLLVYTLNDTLRQFAQGPVEGQAAFAIAVSGWTQGQSRDIGVGAQHLTVPLGKLAPGNYKLIAILDTSTTQRGNFAPGNLYSRTEAKMLVSTKGSGSADIVLSAAMPQRRFNPNDSVAEIRLQSRLLNAFGKKDASIMAGVVLPSGFDRSGSTSYPVVYVIPGWGGTHHQALSPGARAGYGVGAGEKKIYVFLNPEHDSPYGLHGFIDSKVNGPWGRALVEELIPHIQQKYNGSKDPRLNFLMGQSTGGYAAVWLSMHYPGSFGGAWATAPDPLDFRSFVGVDLYGQGNFYTDKKGAEFGFNFMAGKPVSTLRSTAMAEQLEGDGGQFQSFEAAFGPAGAGQRPVPLFDRTTGKIDPKVLKYWRVYDLSAIIAQKGALLKKQMLGEIHIIVGAKDNFQLNLPALMFGEKAKEKQLPITLEEIAGADHFNLRTPGLVAQIVSQLDSAINKVKKH